MEDPVRPEPTDGSSHATKRRKHEQACSKLCYATYSMFGTATNISHNALVLTDPVIAYTVYIVSCVVFFCASFWHF